MDSVSVMRFLNEQYLCGSASKGYVSNVESTEKV
jgi:hypothetical protein